VAADAGRGRRRSLNVGGGGYGAGMAKSTAAFRCSECGWQAAKWVGRCGECQAWGTVAETAVPRLVRAGIRAAGYSGGAGSGKPYHLTPVQIHCRHR